MAKPILKTTIDRSDAEIKRLEDYLTRAESLDAHNQYLIGEVVMLRLFATLERTFEEIALKLCCGTNYLNGINPNLTIVSKSMISAEDNIINYGRKKRINYSRWTTKGYIFTNLEKLMDMNDPYLKNIDIHNNNINEMRVVRNHIAHISKSTRIEFKAVIRKTYGADIKLSAGAYLMSTKRHKMSNITRFVQTSKTIITDITKGY